MRKKLFLLVFSLLLASALQGQEKLFIGKPGKLPKYVFHEGEEIRFKLKGEKHWTKGLIQGLGQGRIRFHYVTIDLDEIAYVDVSGQKGSGFLKSASYIFLYAGVGFTAIEHVNKNLVRGDYGIDQKSLLISGGLLTAGAISFLLIKRKVKVGKRYAIRIGEY